MKQHIYSLILLYLVSILAVGIFLSLHIPLPWILGPLVAVFLLNYFTNYPHKQDKNILNIAFLITGAQIGSSFSKETIEHVVPYFLPFLVITVLLIAICIWSGSLLAKYAKMEQTTGILGSVPGGLSVMVAMSDSMNANTGLVAIFHAIRLMAVLFLVPLFASLLFTKTDISAQVESTGTDASEPLWTIIIYFLLFGLAYLLRHKIPAPFVLVPMILIAISQLSAFPVIGIPDSLYHFAQISIGIHLGLSIRMKDLKKAGHISWIFFLLTLFIILLATWFGYLIATWSDLTFATAMLSLAPGGLVEMAITAHEFNADPAIVGSLQLVRMLFIIVVLPIFLRKFWKPANNEKQR